MESVWGKGKTCECFHFNYNSKIHQTHTLLKEKSHKVQTQRSLSKWGLREWWSSQRIVLRNDSTEWFLSLMVFMVFLYHEALTWSFSVLFIYMLIGQAIQNTIFHSFILLFISLSNTLQNGCLLNYIYKGLDDLTGPSSKFCYDRNMC